MQQIDKEEQKCHSHTCTSCIWSHFNGYRYHTPFYYYEVFVPANYDKGLEVIPGGLLVSVYIGALIFVSGFLLFLIGLLSFVLVLVDRLKKRSSR